MKTLWRKWTFISFLLVITFLIYQTLNQKSCRDYFEEEKSICFDGVITNKFVDKNEHNYPILIIDGNDETIRYNMTSDLSGLFDFVEIGDEIIKEKGFNQISVKRDIKKVVFFLDYGCK